MNRQIFAFSLSTPQSLQKGNYVFSTDGDLIGRILSKFPTFQDDYDEIEYKDNYHYDLETTEDKFTKIESKEIILDIKEYSVHRSNTSWTLKEYK